MFMQHFGYRVKCSYPIVEIAFIINGLLQLQTTMFMTYPNCCL